MRERFSLIQNIRPLVVLRRLVTNWWFFLQEICYWPVLWGTRMKSRFTDGGGSWTILLQSCKNCDYLIKGPENNTYLNYYLTLFFQHSKLLTELQITTLIIRKEWLQTRQWMLIDSNNSDVAVVVLISIKCWL